MNNISKRERDGHWYVPGKTDHEKINLETGKKSNYRKDIFISTVNRAKFIKHFTQGGYTTLVERQNELARLISKSIMKKISKNYIVNNSGETNAKVEAKINELIESMNYQQQEIQYVDKKYTTSWETSGVVNKNPNIIGGGNE